MQLILAGKSFGAPERGAARGIAWGSPVFLKENSHFLQDRPHGPHSLFENRPMIDFQIRNGRNLFGYNFGNLFGGIFSRKIVFEPPGRACPLVLLCHGRGTFQTHSHPTYVHLSEFDFINPDCRLLGKNKGEKKMLALFFAR